VLEVERDSKVPVHTRGGTGTFESPCIIYFHKLWDKKYKLSFIQAQIEDVDAPLNAHTQTQIGAFGLYCVVSVRLQKIQTAIL
jgi:hypothetical protein